MAVFKAGKLNREQKNGLILCLFLFQYSLLIPFMAFINQGLLVAASGIILLTISAFVNKSLRINFSSLILYMTLVLILLLKIIFDGTETNVLLYFIAIATPPLLIVSSSFDRETFNVWSVRLAYLNFIILFSNPFIGSYYSYMRFGYGMLLTPIFLYVDVFHNQVNGKQKIVDVIVLSVSLMEIIIYGARGSLVAFALFFLIDTFLISRKHIIRNIFIIVAGFLLYANIGRLFNFLQGVASIFGVYSYSLKKYQMQFESGIVAASSSRGTIYQEAIEKIKQNPILGNPIIGLDENGSYAHNIFLQVAQDLGIVFLLLLIVFIVCSLIRICRLEYTRTERLILAVLFSVSIGRLLVSSVVWKRPEFWLLICFFFCMKKTSPNKDSSEQELMHD